MSSCKSGFFEKLVACLEEMGANVKLTASGVYSAGISADARFLRLMYKDLERSPGGFRLLTWLRFTTTTL